MCIDRYKRRTSDAGRTWPLRMMALVRSVKESCVIGELLHKLKIGTPDVG